MKTTDICIEEFPIGFTGENTFICGKGETLQSIALAELSKLKAENNTILVTDPIYFLIYVIQVKNKHIKRNW